MASYNKFQDFVEQLGLETHQLNTDTLKCYLSNTTPDAANDAVKADLAEVSSGNGITAGGEDMQNTWSEAAGTASLVAVDIVITATGAMATFRYVPFYNDTATNDNLIGWWDYGAALSLVNGETFTIDFGSSVFTLV